MSEYIRDREQVDVESKIWKVLKDTDTSLSYTVLSNMLGRVINRDNLGRREGYAAFIALLLLEETDNDMILLMERAREFVSSRKEYLRNNAN